MNLAIYLLLALVAGATWGTSLCYLLNAPRTKVSETKQWLSLGASMLVVVSCAVVMKNAGEVGALSFTLKASAAAVFLVSFGAAFFRSKVKL
jgi:Na+/melibiose symporter-like transporter